MQTMLQRFHSYAERSVSGHGIHIYGKCDMTKLPTTMDSDGKCRLDKTYYTKNPSNDTELYIGGLTNRFAVYTGDTVMAKPLRDCTDALLVTLDRDMRRKPKDNRNMKLSESGNIAESNRSKETKGNKETYESSSEIWRG